MSCQNNECHPIRTVGRATARVPLRACTGHTAARQSPTMRRHRCSHNPVKIAEEAAIADILSDGRLEFGVGRGTAPIHYAGYEVLQDESRERFEEALDFIFQAWTHETFSFKGKYFRAHDLSIVPRPVQVPHPPIR